MSGVQRSSSPASRAAQHEANAAQYDHQAAGFRTLASDAEAQRAGNVIGYVGDSNYGADLRSGVGAASTMFKNRAKEYRDQAASAEQKAGEERRKAAEARSEASR
jgi:hypothetical protein